MSTFRELVYMVLDSNKLSNDDSYVEVEHVSFILSKIRAYLIANKYKKLKSNISNSNFQTICVTMQPDTESDVCSSGNTVMRSTEEIPNLLLLDNYEGLTDILIADSPIVSHRFEFVSHHRFDSVGYGRWGQNITYATIGSDKHLYIKSKDSDIQMLDTLRVRGVFEDIDTAATMECVDPCAEDSSESCDPMDKDFPLEEGLITPLIETAVNFFNGMSSKQQDIKNNATDDLSNIIAHLNSIIKERYRDYA